MQIICVQTMHTDRYSDSAFSLCLCNKLNIADFFHFVMLNLFQHPWFRCINLEIPKQVLNDRGIRNDYERGSISEALSTSDG